MKQKSEARLRQETAARAAALVQDLNTVRGVVLDKQRDRGPNEHAQLERRLFESWVIEQLAAGQSAEANLLAEHAAMREQLAEMGEQLAQAERECLALRKDATRLAKQVEKLARK